MKQKLTNFLTQLATDDDLVADFKRDAANTMKKHEVSDEHAKLVLDHEYDKVQEILGADYDISKNTVIHAFKK